MLNPEPTVSVVMCTYNGARFVPEQLDSILAQTYPIFEIIIQDDKSTDETFEVLQRYALKDRRIRLFTVDEKRGINHNFITALDRAQGELIAWSDQDDIWLPDKLEKQVRALQRDDLWVSFHITHFFVDGGPREFETYDHRTPNFELERELFLGTVPGHTMLFRRDLHERTRSQVPEATLERAGTSFYYDTILSIVGNAYGKVGIIVEPLDLHRRVPASVSGDYKQTKIERTIGNAIRQVIRCMNPGRRRAIRPIFQRRMDNMSVLLDCFPDATHTDNVRRIIRAYHSPVKIFAFPYELIRNRDRILFSREKKDWVAILRAALFAITYQDYFASSLK